MADRTEILRQMSDPNRFFVQFPNYPVAVLQELNQAWQWNEVTGLPIFEDPNHRWRRYVPSSLSSEIGIKPEINQFVTEMRGDRRQFFVSCTRRTKEMLLGKVLLSDIKKIQLKNERGGFQVEKTEADILEYDQVNPCKPLRITRPDSYVRISNNDLISEINSNAVRGFKGAGTYRCRDPRCTVSGPLMSQSPVVNWGPGPNQQLALTKRFKCSSNNITYLLHCEACVREGSWTTYVGESEILAGGHCTNFHSRIYVHADQMSNQRLREQYTCDKESLAAICHGVVRFGDPDPDNITKDPYTHFNFVHNPEDRRYSILDSCYGTPGARKTHEGILVHQFGDCVFNQVTHTGSLNRDY